MDLKKDLFELLDWRGPITHRQFMVWRAWLDLQWDNPSRSDMYAMQIATEVRRGYVKSPKAVKFMDMKLKFSKDTGKTKTTNSKAIWMAAVGIKPQCQNTAGGN